MRGGDVLAVSEAPDEGAVEPERTPDEVLAEAPPLPPPPPPPPPAPLAFVLGRLLGGPPPPPA